jgi:hypothetical protein
MIFILFIDLKGLLLGFPLDDFANSLEREACEARSLLNRLADMLVQESMKDIKRHGLYEQNVSLDSDDKQSSMIRAQNLLRQFSLTSGSLLVIDQSKNKRIT